MAMNHSPETQSKLIARVKEVTGRDLREWFKIIDNGPSFLRCEERANWLAEEYRISRGYSAAIVREHERQRTWR
ncbi:hypothetical protein TBS_31700 [Thermobispora bispora]|jgi:hypothetical protein|uniref:DUF4287 domain-containing protein n=1 Tax=Thermobispora bispora (strain ATCC 19993 / DSM 43833 / CBS 139.67 / JCM 10125 / KCTC 9307 / NBRC 14880 / R51) TaxID=469371 RepID=D6Y881_THEBD|nr:DUF4287 domain-containing protein [Thermobispora bispora]MBO2473946.1 DUF4287 domain-containing protein [Actinomycetales bacterium]MDI9581127.1 DUF4287 domain-containing protein [Thermobispora sp.]ADG89817.1 hypothetical protein Tbis_3123 [Thermobispora bispora DSM 43833]MBX6167315.1 DUF4287 domain-containing protein [Thermobispora bispora]QSI49400.1 DUF4287 domain-containing protein [Thermobispora bispora]